MFNKKSSVTRVDSGKPTNIIENNKDDKISDEYVNKKRHGIMLMIRTSWEQKVALTRKAQHAKI